MYEAKFDRWVKHIVAFKVKDTVYLNKPWELSDRKIHNFAPKSIAKIDAGEVRKVSRGAVKAP